MQDKSNKTIEFSAGKAAKFWFGAMFAVLENDQPGIFSHPSPVGYK